MPGKFEGNLRPELAEKLYAVTLESGQDDELGDINGLGWYGLILDFNGKHYIVKEDEQGFFGYTEFNDKEKAQNKWNEIQADYEEYDELAE